MNKTTKPTPEHFIARSADSWLMLHPDVRHAFRSVLARRFGPRCVFCGNPFDSDRLTVDHIVPIAKGGPVCDIGNMRLLCYECHRNRNHESMY